MRCHGCLFAVYFMHDMIKCTSAPACEIFCAEAQLANGGWWIPTKLVAQCRHRIPSIEVGPDGGDST